MHLSRSLMQKALFFAVLIVTLLPLTDEAFAKTKHQRRAHVPAAVEKTANYAGLVIEADTGRILYDRNSTGLRHPASLTKMMTLYVTFQALESGKLSLNQYLPVSSNAAQQSPSKLGLRAGQRIRVEDAVLGVVTESANDAAVVLGEWLGGSEGGFGQMMTRQARALGMTSTRFKNPSGLPDPEQVTTARDMAMLAHALIYHFPQYYPYFSRASFSYAGVQHANHNHLMERYDGMDGIKTGYIRSSGFNLVSSVARGDRRLIGVVFGGRSARARDNQMAQLLDSAFVSLEGEKPLSRVAANRSEAQGDGTGDDDDYMDMPAKRETAAGGKTVIALNTRTTAETVQRGSNWGIQLGAYGNAETSQMVLASATRTLPQLLGTATPVVDKVRTDQGYLYRARLMALDEQTAATACQYILQRGQPCATVGP